MSDWDREWLRKTHEKIEGSGMFLSLFGENYKEDPTALVQLAFAMMLDKPIYIVAQEGSKIPKKFLKIAEGVEFYKDQTDVQRAVQKLIKESSFQ